MINIIIIFIACTLYGKQKPHSHSQYGTIPQLGEAKHGLSKYALNLGQINEIKLDYKRLAMKEKIGMAQKPHG